MVLGRWRRRWRRDSHCRLTAAYKLSSSLDPTRRSVCPGHTVFLQEVETGDIFVHFIHFKLIIMTLQKDEKEENVTCQIWKRAKYKNTGCP